MVKVSLNQLEKTAGKGDYCQAPSCENLANRKKYQICEKHYGRIRRGNSFHLCSRKEKLVNPAGYVWVLSNNHPIAGNNYRMYEHRKVLYEHLGESDINCFSCGCHLTWDILHVDHINNVVNDNRIENLRPSCGTCNRARGIDKMRNTMNKKHGKIIDYNGVSLSVSEWSRKLNISRPTLIWRLKHMSIHDAFTKPIRNKIK